MLIRHTHVFSASRRLTVLVMTVLAALPASRACAQLPRFRLTPLVKLGFTPIIEFDSGIISSFDEAHGTAGINNKGQVGTACSADTDANCAVNTADLLAVIAAWGCTPCGSSFAGGGATPPTLEELIAIVLEAPVSSATQAEIIEELLANYHN